ncbi:MAG: SAM-dependent methyltransferase [Polyangiaceae bacterium]
MDRATGGGARGSGGSRTAHRVAIARAAHQLFDDPRVFLDPLATTLLPDEARRALSESAGPREAKRRALRAFLAARARRAEDALADAVARGVRQYVVLGAGLDTFAFRNPYPELTVFEVDLAATQAEKLALLAARGVTVPATAHFVPADLGREALLPALEAAGARRDATYFSWLGVTPYLERSAILEQLRAIASLPAPSAVTFDYIPDVTEMSLRERTRFEDLSRRVAAAGEPFRSVFPPRELERDLLALGFARVEDLDRDALNVRYFARRTDGLAVVGSGHVVTASVAEPLTSR